MHCPVCGGRIHAVTVDRAHPNAWPFTITRDGKTRELCWITLTELDWRRHRACLEPTPPGPGRRLTAAAAA